MTADRPVMPGTESTAARLARVEAERDRLREDLAQACVERDDMRALARAIGRERDGVREELARQAAECEDLRATLAMRTGQLQASRRELAEAQQALVDAVQRAEDAWAAADAHHVVQAVVQAAQTDTETETP